MKRRAVIPLALLAILALILLGSGTFRTTEAERGAVEIRRGPLEVWSVYEGSLGSRSQGNVMSALGGPATIVEIAPEGTGVKAGDLLVRFDSSQIERDALRLERDHALARAELAGLENAKLPLELRDLEGRLADAQTLRDSEQQYLADCRQLLSEGLMSEQEVKQQELKAAAAESQVDTVRLTLDLTRRYLHPSALEKARAALASTAQELDMARKQLENCTVRAPVDGTVAYKPVHIGAEFRTARVGDTIYRNQPFLALPDMTKPIVQCDVPESELSRVRVGSRAVLVPVAYPDLRLEGTVESVGSMAQSLAGRPEWQRYFRVGIGLRESDDRLRAGMSVRAHVLSASEADTLQVPRASVLWEGDAPYCEVLRGGRKVRRDLQLGLANEQYFQVVSGLEPGERVVAR